MDGNRILIKKNLEIVEYSDFIFRLIELIRLRKYELKENIFP